MSFVPGLLTAGLGALFGNMANKGAAQSATNAQNNAIGVANQGANAATSRLNQFWGQGTPLTGLKPPTAPTNTAPAGFQMPTTGVPGLTQALSPLQNAGQAAPGAAAAPGMTMPQAPATGGAQNPQQLIELLRQIFAGQAA